MTMRAHSKTQPETPGNIDFSPEMLVVRDIDVSDPANDGRVSWFSDKSWCLSPAARKSTSRTSIYFGSSPPEFRDSLKRLVYCAVNLDTPMGEFGRRARTVPRLSVGSVKAYFDTGWRAVHKMARRTGDRFDQRGGRRRAEQLSRPRSRTHHFANSKYHTDGGSVEDVAVRALPASRGPAYATTVGNRRLRRRYR